MPQYNRRELDTRAREFGFNRDTYEKVLRLRAILEFLNTQEYMCEHLLRHLHEVHGLDYISLFFEKVKKRKSGRVNF